MTDNWKLLQWQKALEQGEPQRLLEKRSVVLSKQARVLTLVPMPGVDSSIWGFCFDGKIEACVDPNWASDQLGLMKPLLNVFESWFLNSTGFERDGGIIKEKKGNRSREFPQLVLASSTEFSLLNSLSRWLMSTNEEPAIKLGRWFAWFTRRIGYEGNSACLVLQNLYSKEWVGIPNDQWASWVGEETPEGIIPSQSTQTVLNQIFEKKHPKFLDFNIEHARQSGDLKWNMLQREIRDILSVDIKHRHNLAQKMFDQYVEFDLKDAPLCQWRKSHEKDEAKKWILFFKNGEEKQASGKQKSLSLPPSERASQVQSSGEFKKRSWFADFIKTASLWDDSFLLKSDIMNGRVLHGEIDQNLVVKSSQPILSVRKEDELYVKRPGNNFAYTSAEGKEYRMFVENIEFKDGFSFVYLKCDQQGFAYTGSITLLKQVAKSPEEEMQSINKLGIKLSQNKPKTHNPETTNDFVLTEPKSLDRLKALETFRRAK